MSRGTTLAGSKTAMEGPNAENKTGSEGKQRRVYSIAAPQQASLSGMTDLMVCKRMNWRITI
jgi:hypothetical protein